MEELLRDRISSELDRRDLSLAELSRISKVPYRTLQDIMAMKRTPRVDTVQSIADGLGITSASLMGGMASLEQSQPNEAAKKLRLFQLILGISDEAEIDDLLAHVEDVLGIEPPDDQSLLPKYAKKAR